MCNALQEGVETSPRIVAHALKLNASAAWQHILIAAGPDDAAVQCDGCSIIERETKFEGLRASDREWQFKACTAKPEIEQTRVSGEFAARQLP